MKDINLNLIRTFCLIYEHRGISRAAEELHLTQPTVSYSLKQLRKAFNDQLFYRDRGLLHPTPRAQEVYPDLRAALDLIEGTDISGRSFNPATSQAEFSLMLSDIGESVFLPFIQSLFEEQAPLAQLRIESLDVLKVPDKLASGEIDAAVQTPHLHSNDVERAVIYRDTYVVVARTDHPRIRGTLSLKQMSTERFMRIQSSLGHDGPENSLLKAGWQIRTGVLGTRLTSVPGVVMRSDLLGIIPAAVVDVLGWADRMQVLPLPMETGPLEVSLLSRVKRRRTAAQKWFIGLIKEAMEDMPPSTEVQTFPLDK